MNGNDLIEEVGRAATNLGLGVAEMRSGRDGGDGAFVLPNGTTVAFELKAAERWEFPPGYFGDADGDVVAVQPYVNPRLAERYRERGQFYVDLVGNAWIWTDGCHLLVDGRKPERSASRAPERGTLRTPSELRIAFLLLGGLPVGRRTVRSLASAGGLSIGAAHAALTNLRRRGFVAEGFDVRREQELLDLWLAGFGARLLPSLRSRVMRGVSPRELLGAVEREGLAVTPAGEAVAAMLHSERSVVLYGTPPWTDVVRAGRLRPDPEGDITLREAFWAPGVVLSATRGSAVLTCAELLASDDERLRDAGAQMRAELQ